MSLIVLSLKKACFPADLSQFYAGRPEKPSHFEKNNGKRRFSSYVLNLESQRVAIFTLLPDTGTNWKGKQTS